MVIPKKVVMARTIVKVYLRGKNGDLDSFITPINLSEKDDRDYYIGKWWNMGIETDKMMKCYKVDILKTNK
jgi:hypothetical protein